MAFAPNVAKKWYENLSVEELEAKYKELMKDYCFNSKEEQIDYMIRNYLNASNNVNRYSSRIALEELLKEKTGRDYKIECKRFEISLSDVISFVTHIDPFWTATLSNYFQKLNEISDEEKMTFLIELVQNKDIFNEFTKEIMQTQDVRETYNKYQKISQNFISNNTFKG